MLGICAGAMVALVMKDTRKFIIFLDILLGALGALIGGLLTNAFTLENVMGLYDETILLAVVSAGILIWLGRTIIIRNTFR